MAGDSAEEAEYLNKVSIVWGREKKRSPTLGSGLSVSVGTGSALPLFTSSVKAC